MTAPTELHESTGQPERDVPVCLQCLTPHSPLQHYCENCGETVGQLSPYIPFVNIRYNYDGFSTMWQRIWQPRGISFRSKVAYVFMIVMFAPFILVGLPFVLFAKLKNRNREPEPSISREQGH